MNDKDDGENKFNNMRFANSEGIDGQINNHSLSEDASENWISKHKIDKLAELDSLSEKDAEEEDSNVGGFSPRVKIGK